MNNSNCSKYNQVKAQGYQLRIDQIRYIIFHSSIPPKQIMSITQQMMDNQQQKNRLNRYYKETTGQSCMRKQKQVFLNENDFLQSLQKIAVFGGRYFDGNRYNYCLNGKRIKLTLNIIQNIKFENLQQLYFNKCSLKSIEVLAWLDINNVNNISLSQNDIISLKPLNKGSWTNLVCLNLQRSKYQFNQLKALERMHKSKQNLLRYFHIFRKQIHGNLERKLKEKMNFQTKAKLSQCQMYSMIKYQCNKHVSLEKLEKFC